MQKKWNLIAAAALTVSTGLVSQAFAQERVNVNVQEQNVEERTDRDAGDLITQGVHGTEAAPDAEGIRDTLASTTEAALADGGFNDLVERFVDADRNRLGEAMPDDEQLTSLHQTVEQLRQAWETRYDDEFDIEDEEQVYAYAQIRQGELGETAQVVNGQIQITGMDRTTPDMTDTDREIAGDAAQPAADAGVNDDGDRNLEEGRNVAVVTIPGSHGLPEIRVPLIQERLDSWRIDVPDTLDANTLRMNLEQQLTKAQQMQAQWPADEQLAAAAMTHHVLLAIFDGSPAVQQRGQTEPGQLRNQPGQMNQPGATPPAQQPGSGGM